MMPNQCGLQRFGGEASSVKCHESNGKIVDKSSGHTQSQNRHCWLTEADSCRTDEP
ncbi:hypothetical protein Bca4012_078174 [Brassica carinata]